MNENTSSVDTSNPLDMDLSALDPSLPLIKSGVLGEFKLTKASIMSNEAKTVKMEWESLTELPGDDGGTRKAGTKIFGNLNTQNTGNANVLKGPSSVVAFAQGIGKKFTMSEFQSNPAALQGSTCVLRINIRPAGVGKDGVHRNARNEIAEYVRKQQQPTA